MYTTGSGVLSSMHGITTNGLKKQKKKDVVDVFWNENSVFYRYFKQLDLSSVIELACGHGRHVPYYIDRAGKVTLVDILEENMEICKARFKRYDKLEYYKNNGYNLEKLPDESYTSLFTYDSMVHFELMDVYEYLKDIYRVMRRGDMHFSSIPIMFQTTGQILPTHLMQDVL